MEFRIADTFTESLARSRRGAEAVKITAFDLQMHPAHPGMQLHKLDKARDPHFLSVRVSRDIRLIVHRTAASLLLCYVDHHDHAYAGPNAGSWKYTRRPARRSWWRCARRSRKFLIPTYVEAEQSAPPKARLFEHVAEDTLLHYGVPIEWLHDVRQANEDTLLTLATTCRVRPLRPCWNWPRRQAAHRTTVAAGAGSFRSTPMPSALPGDAQC